MDPMSMIGNIRQARAVTVIDLGGRVTLGQAASDAGSGFGLNQIVGGLANRGCRKILLNLRDVTHMDAAAVEELFGCFTTLENYGGILRLTMPAERVQNLLCLTKLNTVIAVISDEASALRSFQAQEGSVKAA
jgi:anti-anti-sigma factor